MYSSNPWTMHIVLSCTAKLWHFHFLNWAIITIYGISYAYTLQVLNFSAINKLEKCAKVKNSMCRIKCSHFNQRHGHSLRKNWNGLDFNVFSLAERPNNIV